MLTDDDLAGIHKVDLDELKEIKVKLPNRHVIRLQQVKLMTSRTFSQLVTEALSEYFTSRNGNGQLR